MRLPARSGSCGDARVGDRPGVYQRISQISERRPLSDRAPKVYRETRLPDLLQLSRELVARKGEDIARQQFPSRDERERSPRLLQGRAVVAAFDDLLREIQRVARLPEL